jgi:DNA polymerase-3 subunit beta
MKVTVARDRFLDKLAKAERVVGKNPSLPVLSCILLEAKGKHLTVRATNLDVGFEASVAAQVETGGSVAVPGGVLASYIQGLGFEAKLTIELEGGNLRVLGDRSDTTVKAVPHEDFPVLPRLEGAPFTIESADLVVGLKSVCYAAASSSMKPELASVYVYGEGDHLVFAATDSFRLGEKKISVRGAGDFSPVLVPARNVAEVIRIFEPAREPVEIRSDKSQIAFSGSAGYLASRVVDGNFPDYRQIIPRSYKTEVICLKQDALASLRLSTVFADKFNQVTVSADPAGFLAVETKSAERGESRTTLPSTVRGEAVQLSFNQRYLSDCFSSIDSESIRFRFDGVGRPLVVCGVSDPSFTYLVMPISR